MVGAQLDEEYTSTYSSGRINSKIDDSHWVGHGVGRTNDRFCDLAQG